MGLFATRQERRERRADRKRRRADRKRRRADELDQKATALETGSKEETATIIARDNQGRQIVQDVQIRKEESAKRNARLLRLESLVAELQTEVLDLREEVEELTEELESSQRVLERRYQGGMVLSKGALGVMNAMLSFVNVRDRVSNPSALIASEALDALVDLDSLDEQQVEWVRVARVALKALAYYDPKQGLSSIIEADRFKPMEPN